MLVDRNPYLTTVNLTFKITPKLHQYSLKAQDVLNKDTFSILTNEIQSKKKYKKNDIFPTHIPELFSKMTKL